MKLSRTRETDTGIYGFFGKYRGFSNFDTKSFVWKNETWKSGEHAFQAMKTVDWRWYEMIRDAESPSAAKQLGRRCPLRVDWDVVKDDFMYELVKAKFTQCEPLKNLLLSTGDKYLEETNDWGDTYWGVDLEKSGKNKLGIILMTVRRELREENEG